MTRAKSHFMNEQILSYVFLNKNSELEKQDYLYLSLHTGPVLENQTDREVSYLGYSRRAIPRTSAVWRFSRDQVWNLIRIPFAKPPNNGMVITHFALGTAPEGAGYVLYSFALEEPIVCHKLGGLMFMPGDLTFIEE